VLICKLFWHPTCTVLCYGGPLRIQSWCPTYSPLYQWQICPSSWTKANLFNIVHRSWSGRTLRAVFINTCSATLDLFHPTIDFCLIQFPQLCAYILLWITEGFTPFDHKSPKTTRCSTAVQPESGVDVLTLWFHGLHWTCRLPHDMPRLSSVCSRRDVPKSAVWEITRILHANFPSYKLRNILLIGLKTTGHDTVDRP
jgi:hypothetical protein